MEKKLLSRVFSEEKKASLREQLRTQGDKRIPEATESVIADSIRLRNRLVESAAFRSADTLRTDAQRELRDYDVSVMEDAALMIEKLGQEVTRLRLGIGHFEYGQIDKSLLCKMARDWNGSSR